MTDEMTPERLAEIKATAKQHRPGTDYAEHVPALIAEVERLRKENEGACRAAASFKAWDLAGDVDRLTRELEAAEARATAAEAKLAEAVKVLEPFKQLADRYDPPEEDDEHGTWDQTALATLGDIRRARAFLASLDKEFTP